MLQTRQGGCGGAVDGRGAAIDKQQGGTGHCRFPLAVLCGVSDDGQRDAVNLLVDVQGIDVGHAADIVDDSHEPCLQVIALYVVLAARVQEQSADCTPEK